MPTFDPTPGETPSTATSAAPSADTGTEPPTSPGIRPAKAYGDRYEAPYGLADRMETLAGLTLVGGLILGALTVLTGETAFMVAGGLLAALGVVFFGLLSLGTALLRAFVDQAVHSAPLSDAEKQAIVFKKR